MAGFGLFGLLAELFGTEVIERPDTERKGTEYSASGEFEGLDVTLIKTVRFGASSYWQGNTYVVSIGRIQFDYRSAMVSIGGNADEDEAFGIVEAIREQYGEIRALGREKVTAQRGTDLKLFLAAE